MTPKERKQIIEVYELLRQMEFQNYIRKNIMSCFNVLLEEKKHKKEIEQ